MPIEGPDIAILPGGDKISLWVRHDLELFERRRGQDYLFEGIIVDVQTGRIEAQIKNQTPTSPISWNGLGTGAFATRGLDDKISRIKLIDPDTYEVSASVELGYTESDISHVRWTSETQVALSMADPNLKSGVTSRHLSHDRSGKGSLWLVDIGTGAVLTKADPGGLLGPAQCINNGDVWCTRDPVRALIGSEVYSVTTGRTIWHTPDAKSDTAYAVDAKGRILVLSAQKRFTGVLSEMLKHRSCIKRLIPAILDRTVQPTLAVLVDGTTGRVLWSTTPGEVLAGAFGLGSRIALSMAITHNNFGIAVYDVPNGAESIIAESDLPLYIVGESGLGWIAVREDHSVLLVTHGHIETLYDCGAMVARLS